MTDMPQIITDHKGKPVFAVLAYEDYEHLLEKADETAAVRAYDAYRKKRPEAFPDVIAGRFLKDENPVKIFRTFRGLTQKQLANAAGVKQAYIAQIETGKRKGSVAAFKRLARALRVDLDLLV